MKKLLFFLLFLSVTNLSFSQNNSIVDSLLVELNSKSIKDSIRVKILCELCSQLTFSDPQKSMEYGEKGIALAQKNNFARSKANCLYEMGVVYYYQGSYDKSLDSYLKGLQILEILYEKTTDTTKKEIRQTIGDHLHDIGKVYYRQHLYENALKSYNQALSIYKELKYKKGVAGCYNNMAGVYDAQGDFDKTLYYLQQFLKMAEEMGHKPRIATGINNIGLTYKIKGDYKTALEYLLKALKIREELNDTKGLAYSHIDIGNLYLEQKNIEKALSYLHKALEYSIKANAKERIKESYESLANAYAQSKNFNRAYEYRVLLSNLKDTLFNEESVKQMAEMSAKYETDKKQHQIELLEKDKELQLSNIDKSRAETKKQQIQKLAFASGFILLCLLGIVALRSYRQKQRDHQNLTFQKTIIEAKNKDITDSIKYAKRIQGAILPPETHWHKLLPDSFVYYRPKDILSGDFYWIEENDEAVFIAAVDCTGHGVPGALMSIVGYNLLNKAVLEQNLQQPAEILNMLNKWVTITLRQTIDDSSVRDGMDISLCRISKKTNELQWAGAFNPLYIVRNGKLKELRGDKFPIGIFINESMDEFTSHTEQLYSGDTLYLFTDGYADQFGGPKGKKFKYKNLQELLLSKNSETMEKQKENLESTLEDWKGELEQVDDILVIGVRI